MNRTKQIIIFALILLVSVAAVVFITPKEIGEKHLNLPDKAAFYKVLPWGLGLDLVGGTALVYEIDLSEFDSSDFESITSGLRDVVEKRVNQFGVAEPKVVVAKKSDNRYQLLVELAGIDNLEDAVRLIGETPTLDFRVMQISNVSEDEENAENITQTGLTGRHIRGSSVAFDNLNRPVFNFELDSEGSKLFEEVTEENVGNQLCIFVDGDFIFPDDQRASCPMVNEKISGGRAQISGGNITVESANKLVDRFKAGALSAPIELVNQRTISPASAEDSLNKIILAGAIGTALVMLFMILSYGFYGLASVLALFIYIVITLSIFKLIPGFTMTLAGIGGFILSIGMAIDANILIFERTKEEKKRGLKNPDAIEKGFKRAWTSIWDSNISTILTAVILYYLTLSFIRGFALTLGIGVIISMFSAVFVTRAILRIFVKKEND